MAYRLQERKKGADGLETVCHKLFLEFLIESSTALNSDLGRANTSFSQVISQASLSKRNTSTRNTSLSWRQYFLFPLERFLLERKGILRVALPGILKVRWRRGIRLEGSSALVAHRSR